MTPNVAVRLEANRGEWPVDSPIRFQRGATWHYDLHLDISGGPLAGRSYPVSLNLGQDASPQIEQGPEGTRPKPPDDRSAKGNTRMW